MPAVRSDSWDGDFYGDEDLIKSEWEMFPGERVAVTATAVTVLVLLFTMILAQVTIAVGWGWTIGLCVSATACTLLWAMSEAVHR